MDVAVAEAIRNAVRSRATSRLLMVRRSSPPKVFRTPRDFNVLGNCGVGGNPPKITCTRHAPTAVKDSVAIQNELVRFPGSRRTPMRLTVTCVAAQV